jgi:hypothetical protein
LTCRLFMPFPAPLPALNRRLQSLLKIVAHVAGFSPSGWLAGVCVDTG